MAKHIAQLRLPEHKDEIKFIDGWSNNLLKGIATTILSIYGLPGTEFKITQNSNAHTFILNNTGLFSINCEDYPITNLQLHEKGYENILASAGHLLTIDYIYTTEEVEK